MRCFPRTYAFRKKRKTDSRAHPPNEITPSGDWRDSMSEPIVYIDTSEIREGKLEELKR